MTSLLLGAATCKVGILYNLPRETTRGIKTLFEVPQKNAFHLVSAILALSMGMAKLKRFRRWQMRRISY